jgi:hypothetical protein
VLAREMALMALDRYGQPTIDIPLQVLYPSCLLVFISPNTCSPETPTTTNSARPGGARACGASEPSACT